MHSYYKKHFPCTETEEEFSCKLSTTCHKSLMAPFSLLSEQQPPPTPRHTGNILCCLSEAGVESGAYQGGCSLSLHCHSLGKVQAWATLSKKSLC